MRKYYSVRTGKNKNYHQYNIAVLKRLFVDLYSELNNEGYFQEFFGYYCIDADLGGGWIHGKLGENIEAKIYRLLRKDYLWPIAENIDKYIEDDIFDIIEFLYDYVSKPTKGVYHSFNACGMHYSEFNQKSGQEIFREKINDILLEYSSGFELSSNGQILIKEQEGFSNIFEAKISTGRDDIKSRLDLAVRKYRESRSDLESRKIAIRELADILEILRGDAKKYLHNKDESDLFNIANNFAIRHANEKQKIKYDKNIWYSWIFYIYLATIHALLRIKEEVEEELKYEKS